MQLFQSTCSSIFVRVPVSSCFSSQLSITWGRRGGGGGDRRKGEEEKKADEKG